MLKNTGIAFFLIVFVLFSASFAQETDQAKKDEIKTKACGFKTVNYKASTDKNQHPTPEAPADKALIYVIRPSLFGSGVHTKLAVNGEWKGVNRGRNYFFFTVDAGERYFCSEGENQDFLKLTVAAGKTYYLEQKIVMGVWKARTTLSEMTEETGKKKLKDVHLSIFEVKREYVSRLNKLRNK